MNEVLLLGVLLILSAFFSGSEIALFSIGAEKIRAEKNKNQSRRKQAAINKLEALKAEPNKLLVTILLGNNIVNISAASLATLIASDWATSAGMGNTALLLAGVTGVMTFLLLLFGEITPKSLANRKALPWSLAVAPLLNILQTLLYPIVAPLAWTIRKLSGGENIHRSLSEDELKAAIELSEREGRIQSSEKEWVEKILEFGEHTADSVMTPRIKVFALPDDTSIDEAISLISENKFSRVPIYHETLNNTVGILNVYGLLHNWKSRKNKSLKVANLPLNSPLKIPTTMKIDTLLREFLYQHSHMALVYDEHGDMTGLITLEDVIEEIFGEIEDEQDEERPLIRQTGQYKALLDADTELERIEEFIVEKSNAEIHDFPWELEDENKTAGLFFLEKFERLPNINDSIKLISRDQHFALKVTKIDGEKILELETTFIPISHHNAPVKK